MQLIVSKLISVGQVKENISKSEPTEQAVYGQELQEWEAELRRLQDLLVVDKARQKLVSTDLPDLERQITQYETELPDLTSKAEEVCNIAIPASTCLTASMVFSFCSRPNHSSKR